MAESTAATFAEQYGFKSEDAATEILANACRLYQDAVLMLEHDRFASCASLSVLAVEEVAKFMGMIGVEPLPRTDWRNHVAKHTGSANFLLRKRYQDALRHVLDVYGFGDDPAMFARLADMDYAEDEMQLLDVVLAHMGDDGSLMRFVHARHKVMDRIKQAGFYVDLDDQDRVVTTPAGITREQAFEQLSFARDVLTTLQAHLPDEKKPGTWPG